ncbi:MAG: thioredoxin family protein, partial [Bacteroidota bacterium]
DFWATWCSPCKWMDEQTFSRPEVANYLNENYVTVKVNVDNFDGMTYKNKYDIRYLPTIMVLDPAGKVIKKYEEALAPSKLLRVLKDHDENKVLPPYVNRNMVASIERPAVPKEKVNRINKPARTAPAPKYNPSTTGTSKDRIADNTRKYSLSTPVTRANTKKITSVTDRTKPAEATTLTFNGSIYKASTPGKISDSPVAPTNNFSPSAPDAVSDIGLYRLNVRKAPRNGWSVQVGAYYDYKNVLVEVAKFQKSFAEEVLVHISELGGTTCYKVMLGHYNSYEEATNDKKILVEAGARDAFVKDLTTL